MTYPLPLSFWASYQLQNCICLAASATYLLYLPQCSLGGISGGVPGPRASSDHHQHCAVECRAARCRPQVQPRLLTEPEALQRCHHSSYGNDPFSLLSIFNFLDCFSFPFFLVLLCEHQRLSWWSWAIPSSWLVTPTGMSSSTMRGRMALTGAAISVIAFLSGNLLAAMARRGIPSSVCDSVCSSLLFRLLIFSSFPSLCPLSPSSQSFTREHKVTKEAVSTVTQETDQEWRDESI